MTSRMTACGRCRFGRKWSYRSAFFGVRFSLPTNVGDNNETPEAEAPLEHMFKGVAESMEEQAQAYAAIFEVALRKLLEERKACMTTLKTLRIDLKYPAKAAIRETVEAVDAIKKSGFL